MPQDNNKNTAADTSLVNVAQHVHHDVVGVSGVVTLDRPNALNALNGDMVWSLHEIFTLKNDPAVGHGAFKQQFSGFCAGGDVRQVRTPFLSEIVMRQNNFFEANI